jgi:hypothetical protein
VNRWWPFADKPASEEIGEADEQRDGFDRRQGSRRSSDHAREDLLGRRETRQRVQYTIMMLVALLCCFGVLKSVNASNGTSSDTRSLSTLTARVAGDEHATCVIQARGLPAGHALKNAMVDIHTLLTLPLTPAQVAQRRKSPPSPQLLGLLANLDRNLGVYAELEDKQPATRTCVMPVSLSGLASQLVALFRGWP